MCSLMQQGRQQPCKWWHLECHQRRRRRRCLLESSWPNAFVAKCAPASPALIDRRSPPCLLLLILPWLRHPHLVEAPAPRQPTKVRPAVCDACTDGHCRGDDCSGAATALPAQAGSQPPAAACPPAALPWSIRHACPPGPPPCRPRQQQWPNGCCACSMWTAR